MKSKGAGRVLIAIAIVTDIKRLDPFFLWAFYLIDFRLSTNVLY